MPKLLQYTYCNAMVLLLFNYASAIVFCIMKPYEILSKLRVVHYVYRKGKNVGFPWQPHVRLFIFSQNKLVVLWTLYSCTCQSLHRLNSPTTFEIIAIFVILIMNICNFDQICTIAAVKYDFGPFSSGHKIKIWLNILI